MKQALLQALFALGAASIPTAAGAQAASSPPASYPTKPIRIVVPFTAGSATDIMARIIGPKLVERWGRQIVTDNRPSAGGIVACSIVAEAEPDGHTLMVTGSNFAGSAALYSKLPYDPVKDFSGITQIASTPLVLVVAPTLGVKSVKEVVRILELAEIKERISSQGALARPSSPQAFDKLVHDEIDTRRKVWKAAGVKAE